MQTFGQWLYSKRKATKLTQQELAERSGLSKSYISTLEREATHSVSGGELTPSRDSVLSLANGLGMKDVEEALLAAGYAPEYMLEKIEIKDTSGKVLVTFSEEGTEYDPDALATKADIARIEEALRILAEKLGKNNT